MDDLFEQNLSRAAPLADRMRPRTLDEFYGQAHIVGPGKLLRRAIETDRLTSSIFFGPPGSGKTTLAYVIASTTGAAFEKLNAVTSGVKDVREIIERAEERLKLHGQATYLLLDECHRWSKTQSDSILPAIEKGIIRFIGSTTENPMVAMTSAIVSRCRLFQFYALTKDDVKQIMRAALTDRERGLGALNVQMDEDAMEHIANVANGDARAALNAVELAVLTTPPDAEGVIHITLDIAEESIQRRAVRCDDEEYYNMLSAFCKSLRGSDADAALFWFGRMIYAGVDPRLIVRRIIAHASEDIGLANPSAMTQAVAAAQALEFVGMPEARLSIAQAIIFLCESPKSNSVVVAVEKAFADAEHAYQVPVPMHLRDTSYPGADKLGSGKGYKYPHDYERHYTPQQYLPDNLVGRVYYQPSDEGYEKKIKEVRRYMRREE
ncbi:MAG: replication-associated recombination protein A [Christensenellaceae bacterium]|nr:replication-associated recombination protein A [Christensenellaceae bacterium]